MIQKELLFGSDPDEPDGSGDGTGEVRVQKLGVFLLQVQFRTRTGLLQLELRCHLSSSRTGPIGTERREAAGSRTFPPRQPVQLFRSSSGSGLFGFSRSESFWFPRVKGQIAAAGFDLIINNHLLLKEA